LNCGRFQVIALRSDGVMSDLHLISDWQFTRVKMPILPAVPQIPDTANERAEMPEQLQPQETI